MCAFLWFEAANWREMMYAKQENVAKKWLFLLLLATAVSTAVS